MAMTLAVVGPARRQVRRGLDPRPAAQRGGRAPRRRRQSTRCARPPSSSAASERHALLGEPRPELQPGSWSPSAQARAALTCRRPPAVRPATAAKSRWSAVELEPHSPRDLAREAEDPLGDDVALHLVGAGVDRAGQRERVAVQPRRLELGSGPSRSSAVSCSAMSSSDQNTLLTEPAAPMSPPSGKPGDSAPGVEPVGLRLDPRVDDPAGGRGSSPGLRQSRRRARAAGRPRHRTGRGSAARARARCPPYSSRPTSPSPGSPSTSESGTKTSSKKISAKPASPSSWAIGRTVTPEASSGKQEVGQPVVPLRGGVRAEQPEPPVRVRRPRGPGLLSVEHPAAAFVVAARRWR